MSARSSSMMDPEESGGGAGVDRLRAAWSRRKWLAVILFVLPLTAAVTLAMSLPDIYRSSATVLIEGQQLPEAFVRSTVTGDLEVRLTTIGQEILSRSRLEPLIQRFGLYADLRQDESQGPLMEAAIARMRNDVSLELRESEARRGPYRSTIAFAVSYRGREPETVALVTNTLASSYVEENLKVRERQASGTTEFLRAQLTAAKKRLDDQEGRVSELRGRYLGELPQQVQANLSRLESMNSQLRLNNDNQVRLVERRETLAAQLAQAQSDSGVEPDEARLQRLKGEIANLRIKYTDLWPDITRLKDEIATLEKKMAEPKPRKPIEEVPPTPQVLRLKEALKSAETELGFLKAEEQRLRREIATYQARIDNAPKREQQFADLTRDYATTKEVYDTLLKRHEESQVAERMEQLQKGEQFRLLEPATPAGTPSAPNRLRLLMMSLALSVVLAVGGIVLAEILDTSFHAVDALRTFSTLPVLVAIPRIMTEADARKRRNRFRLATAAVLVGLALTAGVSYFVASGNERLTNLISPPRNAGRS